MNEEIRSALAEVYEYGKPENFFRKLGYALEEQDLNTKENISVSIRYALDVYKVSDPKVLSVCTRQTRSELDVIKDTTISVEVLISTLYKIFLNDSKARFMLSPLVVYSSIRLEEIYDYEFGE